MPPSRVLRRETEDAIYNMLNRGDRRAASFRDAAERTRFR